MNTEHSIFKAIVEMYNQTHCDIAREICEKYSVPVWENVDLAFDYVDYEDDSTYLQYRAEDDDKDQIGFYVDNLDEKDKDDFNIVSIEEFEALAEDYNPQYKSMEDILSKLKELNNLLNNK